jgi:hypothetical protein
MSQIGPAPTPWWLVPNLLALDAPVVAVVWQRFLAARSGVPVPWSATAALAAVVWCVYLADRYLDAQRGAIDAARHRAAARYPRLFAGASVLAACLAAVAAARLPLTYVWCGLATGLAIAAYLVLAHSFAGSLRCLPGVKEFLVAIGFAAGVAVPLEVSAPRAAIWLPGVAAFGGLCWLNCRLIDRWEAASPCGACWPDCLLGVALLGGAFGFPAETGAAVACSVLGLLAVHVACRNRPCAARALADLVLLAPLAWWTAP